MRHGLQLAGITLLWLVDLNTNWDSLVPHCILGSCDQWEFPPFFRPQWQSFCTVLTADHCLSLRLCKGTVKYSTTLANGTLPWLISRYIHFQRFYRLYFQKFTSEILKLLAIEIEQIINIKLYLEIKTNTFSNNNFLSPMTRKALYVHVQESAFPITGY